ncbi:DUF1573 domain-containing protein [Flaviaesturariibacter amylovorans]|uniref:DUF1573 domain-containing protein n=1 Tax=Flaviaesturariibacter amylovorans TaxID=1084520 RepID=A0ABP8GNR7_9BACT
MKHLLTACTALVLFAACTSDDAKHNGAQKDSLATASVAPGADSANATTIQWLDSTYQDMGRVMEGGKVEVAFRFRNTGTKPLIIQSANATCGCTVAEKPNDPIAPGAEGRIVGTFNSEGRVGTNDKNITVIANTLPQLHDLRFKVEVAKNQ